MVHAWLLAFGLSNPPALAWLAAIAVPIVIHLWSRRRHADIPWAAMRFLAAAARRQRLRTRLAQWLLLAARAAIIAVVVLAAAEPRGDAAARSAAPGAAVHRLLVLDVSYSMACRDGTRDRLDKARRSAAAMVQARRTGDAFGLILMGRRPRAAIAAPAFDDARLLAELARAEVDHAAADVAAALTAASELLAAPAWANADREVVVLSDMDRRAWDPPDGRRADVRQAMAQVAKAARLVLIDVGAAASVNGWVAELSADDAVLAVGKEARFEARLRHSGPAATRRLEWWVDGRREAEATVALGAAAQASASFAYTFRTPGDHTVEARLDADALELDDRRLAVARVREPIRTLCVAGGGQPERFGHGADFLAAALAADPREAPAVARIDDAALADARLEGFDALWLVDVPQFTPAEAAAMAEFARRGGAVIFFVGPRTLPDRYNAVLRTAADGGPLLPARLGEALDHPADRVAESQHPAMALFRGRSGRGPSGVPAWKSLRLADVNQRAATLLSLDSGRALAVEQPYGAGRVVLVATSAGPSWNALPLLPAFVPFVRELLAWSVYAGEPPSAVLVGATLQGPLPAGRLPAIRLPDGSEAAADRTGGGWSYGPVERAGLYRVVGEGKPSAWSVNLDTSESTLERTAADELKAGVIDGVPLSYQTSSPQRGANGLPRDGGLSSWLLAAGVALLLLETIVARPKGWRR